MIYFRPLLGNIASLVALILLFLCIFAGSSRQLLPDANILSVSGFKPVAGVDLTSVLD